MKKEYTNPVIIITSYEVDTSIMEISGNGQTYTQENINAVTLHY